MKFKNWLGLKWIYWLLWGGGVVIAFWWNTNGQSEREYQMWQEKWREQLEKGKEAILIRRVSEQMEQVAYQQKDISDQQRMEAVRQRIEAEHLRQRAEMETKRAVKAERNALIAYREMEQQKRRAEQHRKEAVIERERADTLANLALGRSLGALAIARYQAGEFELSALLSWWSWKLVQENGGDCFLPEVFNALALNDKENGTLLQLNGAIRALLDVEGKAEKCHFAPNEWCVFMAAEGGEVAMWRKLGGYEENKMFFSSPKHDFRCMAFNREKGQLLVAGFSGEVVELSLREKIPPRSVETGFRGILGITDWLGQWVVACGNGEVRILENKDSKLLYSLREDMTVFDWRGKYGLVGDKTGRLVWIDQRGHEIACVEGSSAVKAVARHEDGRLAIGYESGLLVVVDSNGGMLNQTVMHLSGITGIAWMDNQLVSVGYDGQVRLWQVGISGREPLTVASFADWLYDVVLSPDGKFAICGGESGKIYRVTLSPAAMAGRIKQHIKRELTPEERQRYFGLKNKES